MDMRSKAPGNVNTNHAGATIVMPRWLGWHAARRALGTNLYRLGIPDSGPSNPAPFKRNRHARLLHQNRRALLSLPRWRSSKAKWLLNDLGAPVLFSFRRAPERIHSLSFCRNGTELDIT